MRPIQTIIAAVSAMSILSACSGGATLENESASGAINDQESVEVNAIGPEAPSHQETNTGGSGEPPAQREATPPQSMVRATAPDRALPSKAPRARPEPDPHAGHDMGNMANMSHD